MGGRKVVIEVIIVRLESRKSLLGTLCLVCAHAGWPMRPRQLIRCPVVRVLLADEPVAHLGLSLEPSTGSLRLLIILPSLVHTYPLLLSSFSKTAPVPLLSCQSYPMPTNHLQLPMPRPFVHPCHSCGVRSSLRLST
ncbi:hypothetical protein BD309DRAFT_250203 [Dichomitus squalens]|nr:hypothetical protein BD309DRAFT_250203 [Dichomitus squalens]